jgi:hypothetical protein
MAEVSAVSASPGESAKSRLMRQPVMRDVSRMQLPGRAAHLFFFWERLGAAFRLYADIVVC